MTKIMLVEDDKSLREIYGIRLLAEGYEIKSAGDGEEALAMAIKERPDLIISDVMMPKISGFDMLDILRSTPETKDIKIIMMTALSSEDQRARGEALGANRYLVKSQVGIEDVVRTVHDVLADVPKNTATPAQMFGSATPSARPFMQQTPRPTVQNATTQQTMTPQASMMPQPTAPFSSPAPASLGNQIFNPSTQRTNYPNQPSATQTQPNMPSATNAQPQPQPYAANTYAPRPTIAQTPYQDIIMPQQNTAPRPDLSSMINQELNNTPPQEPRNNMI
jgi:CheY-like chemotaxis protein